MAKIQEVHTANSGTDTEPLEKVDSNVIPDSPDICDNDIQTDQNAEECDDEHVALANLIANLKLDIDENKKIQKQLKKANKSLTQELKECKSTLEETNRTLGESNSTRDSCLIALQNKQIELEKYKTLNDHTIDYDKLERKLNETLGLLAQKEHDIKEDAYNQLQCLYVHKVKECECLAKKLSKQTENVSKEVYNRLLRSFAKLEKHSISLKLALQQCQEQLKNDTVCKENASTIFLKEREQYFEIQDLKAQLQDKNIAISELKKLIQKIPKPSVLGTPTIFSNSFERKKFSKTKSVTKTNVSKGLSKPVTTQILPPTARQAVRNTNVIKPGMYRIDTRITQTRAPQLPQTSKNTNPCVSTSIGVIHRTSVSRPQLKSTQMKDKVVQNNIQVKFKKTEVEDHHRISSISNKTKHVTACNDSLKSKTSNVNAVCVTCGKCVFNSNHDACVSKFLNDVNARSKKPQKVPIRTRKPISRANQSVARPPKKQLHQTLLSRNPRVTI
ncbi:hypothetical protein Tco_0449771 [Tanacetum coccineum]